MTFIAQYWKAIVAIGVAVAIILYTTSKIAPRDDSDDPF